MSECGFCIGSDDEWSITNLGAILFANNLNDFENSVVVRSLCVNILELIIAIFSSSNLENTVMQ